MRVFITAFIKKTTASWYMRMSGEKVGVSTKVLGVLGVIWPYDPVTWKAAASSAARMMCALVLNKVRPAIKPLASINSRQR